MIDVFSSGSDDVGMTKPLILLATIAFCFCVNESRAEDLMAGVGKVDITREGADAGTNPLWVKAVAISRGETHAIIVSVDAVAIAEIGSIKDPYLKNVRSAVQKSLGISPESIVVNASHCHGVVALDVEKRTIDAITMAWKNRVPVRAGTGSGDENRVGENRRLILKDGSQADVRHAYSLPGNDEVAAVGPIDSEIGILRLDRVENGEPLAVIYNFACHPIQGIPSGGNTADLTGFASNVIERNLGDGTAMALFLQGCGGDINPVIYKPTNQPRDGEPLGNYLGLSVLEAVRKIKTNADETLSVANETLVLPRSDLEKRIAEMEVEVDKLVDSLKGTTLNFDAFLPLYVKYHLSGDYPSYASHRYLQDEMLKRDDWQKLDENNKAALAAYVKNIRTMEWLTRKQINLALLERHHARNKEAGKTVDAEVVGLRVGDFYLVTFPAELTVQIGLNIKKKSPHKSTFVAGYTNGYLYYAPTSEQLKNRGGAQEDSDCLLAPEWQEMFEKRVSELLKKL
ncbi:hypothetical protein OAE61_00735 [Verrucomicrobiales bacterium]|nr:hypothetical protein [Verrucomicrobiales bacterium]MDC0322029.1 hypothetical protein [Verrucomicrobiales bacterium]